MRLSVLCLEDRLAPAAGDLDPGFNGTGIATSAAHGASDLAVAPDGGIVLVRTESNADSPSVGEPLTFTSIVTRLRPDGRPDPSFHGDGSVVVDTGGFLSAAEHVALLPDGSILVVVVERLPDAVSGDLYRVSADGQTVSPVGRGGVNGLVVHPTTGEVYLLDTTNVGFLPPDTPPPDASVTRLDRNLNRVGSLAIDVSGGTDLAQGIALDAEGRVYVVTTGRDDTIGVARVDGDLNPASVSKATFDVGRPTPTTGLAVGPTGQVFVASGTPPNAPAPDTVVLRLGPDLSERARATVAVVSRSPDVPITTDNAGRVIVAGSTSAGESTAADVVVTRLNPLTLAPDTTFAGTGRKVIDVAADDFAHGVAVDAANRIVVTATASTMTAPRTRTGVVLRLFGSSGGTISALLGGPTDGKALGLAAAGGKYAVETPVALFGGAAVSIRTAVADVNGDGVLDLIGGTGPGVVPRVTIIDGASRQILAFINPFEPAFTGGVFVAAGDVDGDGRADIVVTPDQGGGPVVAVYSGAKLLSGPEEDAQIARFFGIEDAGFRGGARPAAGDVTGDGKAEVVVAAGFLGGPRVAVFDGAGVAAGGPNPPKLVGDFFAFEDTLRNGAFVAVGDTTGDGRADLAFGGGPGGAPRVRVFDGAKLLAAGAFTSLDDVDETAQVANFFAGDDTLRGGVRLAFRDADADRRADLLTGSGVNEPSRVRVYLSATLLGSATPAPDQELDPFGAPLAEGVFVG